MGAEYEPTERVRREAAVTGTRGRAVSARREPLAPSDAPSRVSPSDGAFVSPVAGATRIMRSAVPTLSNPGQAAVTAVSRIRRARSSTGLIQRTLWVYGTDGQWSRVRGEPTTGPAQPVQVPPASSYRPGDTFDDTDPDRLFSGMSATIEGQPNSWVGYQEASARETKNMQAALALAKLKLRKGLVAVQKGVTAARSGPIAPRLATVVEAAFNVAPDVARVELLRILQILEAGLVKLRDGLNSDVLVLSSASRMRSGFYDEAADCSGWVPMTMFEAAKRPSKIERASDLSPLQGAIHIKSSNLDVDDFNAPFVADTIIHEAAHKYLGAFDYSYIGVQGSVTSGLADKAGVPNRAADQIAWDSAKATSSNRAYAQVAQAIVERGLGEALPLPAVRTLVKPTDTDATREAKRVWALVSAWGRPNVTPPTPDELNDAIKPLLQEHALSSSSKDQLRSFLKDKERFLAVEGNDLNVKGHDVLFALSTGYLLKNADSWTELALSAGG